MGSKSDLTEAFAEVYLAVTSNVPVHKWLVAHDLVTEYQTRWRSIGPPARMDQAAYVRQRACGLTVRASCLFTQRDSEEEASLRLSGQGWSVRGWASKTRETYSLDETHFRFVDLPTQRGLLPRFIHNCYFEKGGSVIAERNLSLLKLFASELAQ